MELHNGVFPKVYADLIKLKGIGDYTAAAISSFANNESKPVVDGNVFRVLARYFGVDMPINSTNGKKQFDKLAQELIVGQDPAIYNQAMMEFGALQCKPKLPLCASCPLNLSCYALNHHKVDVLPVKLKKVKVKERWFNYFIGIDKGHVLTKKRMPGDIWQEMYDFPLIETTEKVSLMDGDFIKMAQNSFGSEVNLIPMGEKKHLLTHQIIYVQFFALDNYIVNFNLHTDIKSVLMDDFLALPHPKIISDFIEKHIKN